MGLGCGSDGVVRLDSSPSAGSGRASAGSVQGDCEQVWDRGWIARKTGGLETPRLRKMRTRHGR